VDQVIDMLALMGDAVDNIPGLPGIGEKTAAKLLAEYDNVENLLANAGQLKGKQQEIVKNHADKAVMSKWLARIDINVPVQFDDKHFEIEPFNREELVGIFKELEFRSLADKILRHPLASPVTGAPASQPAPASARPGGVQGSLFGDDPVAAPVAKSPLAVHQHASGADKNIHNVPHEYRVAATPEERAALLQLLSAAPAVAYDS
jgi:DNA polymerase-1